ncbi:MAG TPA: aminotransferase class I/II-fold pyridoxal phosphate-dependent enzyme, partial [Isosphaeraceae bacterium]|nr:aminotransferase class I/II-fold pyridoxal phosphate-dependent enzyme [Isosphaeraceae bacterium]
MSSHFQPHIERMAGYVPGEQPRNGGFIKLNTNENPYPPSEHVVEVLREAISHRLRLYPDPDSTAFRQVAAKLHGVEPDMVLAGNGSDDLLTIISRAFVGPDDLVIYPTPSYILYKTLIDLQNARASLVHYSPDWTLEPDQFAHPRARLAFLANPNSPSGTSLSPDQVGLLAAALP